MNRALHIIPECYADTNLITTLVQSCVNHQKGCTRVAGTMNEKFADRFAVGVIDHDKRTPGYLDKMDLLSEYEHLRLYKHPTRPHYLITIKPAIEELVISCAKELDVDTKLYGVPSSMEELKKMTKCVDSNGNPQLTALFRAFKTSKEMTVLRETLEYLNNKKYQTNIEELKGIFSQFML